MASFESAVAAKAARKASYAFLGDAPSRTRDGEGIAVLANAGLLLDVESAVAEGAEEIGLFRTELSFLGRGGLPTAEEQIALYREVRDIAGDQGHRVPHVRPWRR